MKVAEMTTMTIGDIVTQDFRTSEIFKEAGIDFCCGGKKTLEEACVEKGIDAAELAEKLANPQTKSGAVHHKFNEWQPGFLCDYIVNEHHTFVRNSLPELEFYTRKIATVHGEHHSELLEVADLFSQISNELTLHMKKEEEILFPAIKEFFISNSDKSAATIKSEIAPLLDEHEFAGGAMDKIRELTADYKLPSDACNSYRLTFEMLEKFEDDLHTHVHLENNILIPKTLDKLN